MPENNKYHTFSEADFLTDEYFQSWIFNPDEETNLFWKKFISDNPRKAGDISQAKRLLESIGFKEDFPSTDKVKEYLQKTLAIIENQKEEKSVAKIRSFRGKWWAAAASVVLLLTIGYFFFNTKTGPQVAKVSPPVKLINDAAPGGNKAILTLGNGQTIILDSAGNGILSTQGSSTVTKMADGQLVYKGENKISEEVVYNTISTPRGGQYNLTLSDGSRVWLNAESSLRFPASFSGDERKVELIGEGYFEIAQDAEKVFKVSVNKSVIEVLGTHFNINGYTDENNLRATLLQGSVKVIKGAESIVMKPGQQAVVSNSTNSITIKNNINVEEVIAWKNGLFQFDDTEIKEVMRQIGRWYNLEVEFEGNVPDKKITGKIYRNVQVSKVLRIMEALKIQFKIEGKTIVVTK
ncbi:MAG: FecR domain-containing protein [Ginsengibacter sp.]